MSSVSQTAPPQQQPERPADALQIGDILVGKYGWDQTNIAFYQVTSVAAKTVVIRRIQSQVTAAVGWAHQMNVPVADAFIGYSMRRKVKDSGGEPCVLPTSFEVAVPWDGTEQMSTHYA